MEEGEARAVLGVGAAAPWPEVRAAYRRLVREHHPDRAEDAADAGVRTVRTAQLTLAFSVLAAARRGPEPTRVATAPAPRDPRPWVADLGDTRRVLLDVAVPVAFQALLEVAHHLGAVTYVDRFSGVLEVVVEDGPGRSSSLLVDLEPEEGRTAAMLGVEPLGRHEPPSIDDLVDQLAHLLAHPEARGATR